MQPNIPYFQCIADARRPSGCERQKKSLNFPNGNWDSHSKTEVDWTTPKCVAKQDATTSDWCRKIKIPSFGVANRIIDLITGLTATFYDRTITDGCRSVNRTGFSLFQRFRIKRNRKYMCYGQKKLQRKHVIQWVMWLFHMEVKKCISPTAAP